MSELKLTNRHDYALAVCHFLAEGLRSRQISLMRGAEIAEKVIQNLNLIDSEYDFLRLVKELSKDFDELLQLEQRISMFIKGDERKKMEIEVKEFVITSLAQDAASAVQLMEAAIKDGADSRGLAARFPKFKEYLDKKNERNRVARN
jgi:hypothetical protein